MAEIIDSGAMLKVGTVLKNTYRIEDYLASGGFGNTYIAKNIEFDDIVAIKEFYISGVTERDNNSSLISVSNYNNQQFFEEQLKKFKKEARRLHRLKHENIVGVHDLFEENGTAYYVMDYIDGESLAQRIKDTGMPIGEKDAMNYLMQILDALETVHDKGILHLDIKPGNIMIDKSGNIKLIDFGASKQQSGNGSGATTSTAVAYTNGFAPREQMEQNLSKFGPWTDIYALGATLYNLLTTYGPPLPSDLDDDRTPDKRRALPMPYVSVNTQKLILWMMTTDRLERPQAVANVRRFLSTSEPATMISPLREQPVQQIQQPIQQKESEQEDVLEYYDEPETKKGYGKIIAISGIAAMLIAIFAIWGIPHGDDDIGLANVLVASAKTADNIDYLIDNLGKCKYTGEVNDIGQPHGKGKAVFHDGRRYEGPFVNGKCHGDNAEFTYDNGDTFEGTFQENAFKERKYTIRNTGEYFIGTFKNGQPNVGKWYYKNGKEQN